MSGRNIILSVIELGKVLSAPRFDSFSRVNQKISVYSFLILFLTVCSVFPVQAAVNGVATITGTAMEGQTLMAGVSDVDDTTTSFFNFQWKRGAIDVGTNANTYALTQLDVNSPITVTISYTDDSGSLESPTSVATAAVTNVNNPVTGEVTINNTTPAEGDTLTASNTLMDIDGLGAFTYQWKRGAIGVGTNANTYALTQLDVNSPITVTISYSDVFGAPESKTSASTANVTNVNDVGIATINGATSQNQGQTLTVTISDNDGVPASNLISYQWKRGATNVGTNANTYVLTQADVGSAITVVVSYTDVLGFIENRTSAPVFVLNTNDIGVVTISGTPEEDRTLTAEVSDIDGLPTSINYQWTRNGSNIAGATSKTYLLQQLDVNKNIRVSATYMDPLGGNENITSSLVTVSNVNDIGTVTLSGTVEEDSVLMATVADPDGVPASIVYEWKRSGSILSGVTSNNYTLKQNDVGEVITVTANYTDPLGGVEDITSNPTIPVGNINDSGAVIITGTRTQGQTLSAAVVDDDGPIENTFIYQWSRGGAPVTGATLSSYDLTQADVGSMISVTVDYSDAFSTGESATSSATTVITNVNDVGVVAISGTATKGETLTATVTDVDGEPLPANITYQWKRNGGNISAATSQTYVLTQSDVGSIVTVTATYNDLLGGSESVTSNPTVTVADVNNAGAASISGIPSEDQTLSVSISDIDGTSTSNFSYQWKRDAVDIVDAIAPTYNLVQDDVGALITVTVNYLDDLGNAESVTSLATAPVANVNDIGIATISGDVVDGGVLTVSVSDADGTTTSTLTYQWKLGGVGITGATENFYTIQSGDIGSAISVTVSYTDDLGGVENITSSATTTITDTIKPVITLPADITVDAEGLFTLVDIGAATAVDNKDGPLTPTSNAPVRFSPGVTEVIWSVTDAAGNRSEATQIVTVKPLADFSVDQTVAEASTVRFRIHINSAVTYDVDVPYQVRLDSTADSSDHSLVDGTATIVSGEDSAEVSFTVSGGSPGEGIETINIDMLSSNEAALGIKTSIVLSITEENIAPVVSLTATQVVTTRTILINGTEDVRVDSNVVDPNSDALTYDWSATDNALIESNGNVTNSFYEFDPSGLTPGSYTMRLAVSDGSATTQAELALEVLSDAPISTIADNDNDGVPNFLEDASGENKINVLPSQRLLYTSRLLETEAGLKLSLGNIAIKAGKGQANVTAADVSNEGNPNDFGFAYPSGLFDFDIEGLGAAGQSTNIVLPQQVAIPADATYRKLVGNNWQPFVVNDNNIVATAQGVPGFCPPTGDASYAPGLTAGHYCVQLTIEDGGPNDGDGALNNRISDPSGVAVTAPIPKPPGSDDSNGIFGLGSMSLWFLSLLGLFGLRKFNLKAS